MRNRISFLILFIFSACSAFSQVTTEPAIAVENQSVKIIFDATKGTGGLADYTGDIYAHIGVITDQSTTDSDWKYVIAEWTENIEKAKLSKTADSIYELEISPDIRSFFGVSDGEEIQQIALVFRSGDGSKDGKADGNKDIFVKVVQEGLAISFINPPNSVIIEKDEALPINVSTTLSADIVLIQNDEVLKEENGSNISYSFTQPSAGDYWLFATATANEETVKDSVLIVVQEESITETQPAGIKKGINYTSDTSVTLSLFAPGKQFVYVVGDFNDWQTSSAYQMKKDGDTFWLSIDNLEAGQAYVFQYDIDGEIKLADPYAEQISDPWNDQHITNTTYPNLVTYPADKASGIASVIQTGQANYEWEVSDFQIPEKSKLVIYEMLIRDFTDEHSYKSIQDRLDYLEDLNINVLELMPVNEFEGNLSWGYNPSFYFAPDKYYGSKNELKKLIDECHKRGIAVVIDMVLNHSYNQSPFVQMYWDSQLSKPATTNPWYNQENNFANPDAQWGNDFNHESAFTKELLDSINSFWMNEYQIDGFRFDFTKGFSNTPYGASSWGSPYDAARIANLKRMADEIWTRKENALVIFEHLSDNVEEKELADYGIMLWGNMNHNYGEAAMGYTENKKSDLSWGIYKEREWTEPNLVSYMESHDEERLTYKLQQYGNSSGSYNTKDLGTALDRMELNSVFFIPLPGPKMIWQMGELGYDISIDYNGRVGEKPIKWDFLEDENRTDLFQVMSKLNHLKQTYSEFQTSDISYFLENETKWYKLSDGDNHVVVVGNFSTTAKQVTVNFPKTGDWYNFFAENTFTVNSTNMQISLQAGEYILLSTRQFTAPHIVTNTPSMESNDFIHIYPNPAQDYITIDSGQPIEMIRIFDLEGRLMKQYQPYSQKNNFDIQGLKSGLYVVSVQSSKKYMSFSLIKH